VDLIVENDALIYGNLDVEGETTLFRLTVEENAYLNTEGGETIINGPTTVHNTLDVDASTHLNIEGGSTVVEGPTTVHNTLDVDASTHLNIEGGSTVVEGPTTVHNTLDVDASTHLNIEGGSTNIHGATTISGATIVNNTSNLNGKVIINAAVTGGMQDDITQYPLLVKGGDHGVAIQVNGITPQRNTNFLTVFDGNGDAMGRIEGFQGLTGILQNLVDAIVGAITDSSTPSGNPADVPPSVAQYFNNDYAVGALMETLDLANGIVKVATNATACAVGVGIAGDCDDVFWSVVDAVVQGIQLGGYIAYNEINIGAAFESGGADYAEWLEKASPMEQIYFGEVVGVKGGIISKDFIDADKFMVISNSPTIIGAMPSEGRESMYEKIAFMGQVPVKVIGAVNRGDYILPSGNNDGMAIAVSKDNMKAKDYGRIVGIAWSESDGKELFDYITTAVGINSNDMAKTMEDMQIVINQIQMAMRDINPNFQPTYFDVDGQVDLNANHYTSSPPLDIVVGNQLGISEFSSKEEVFNAAKEYVTSQELDMNKYPYFLEILENPSDIELMKKARDHYLIVIKRCENIMAYNNKKRD
jgi:hypothetical protein